MMEEENVRTGTLERVDLFYLPMFLYNNVLADEQCEALLDFCKEQEYESTVGEDSRFTSISTDTDVISKIPDMREFFEKLVDDISYQVMKQQPQAFTIQNSWCTKTEKGQSSMPHVHKNYYMSGILYLQDNCSLELHNPLWDKNNYVFDVTELTPYTCYTSLVNPPKGSFLLMPAWMYHGIPKWGGDDPRYSIAMNIHPTGEYGLQTSRMYVK